MKAPFKFLFGRLLPFGYNPFLKALAYGPWGSPLHQIFIAIYRKIYGIEDPGKGFKRLGDFFLREREIKPDLDARLVSPAESFLLEEPEAFKASDTLTIK